MLLFGGEFGEHREGEGFAGGAFGFGEVALFIIKVAEAVLEVERDGVVDLRADAVLFEVRGERVALAVGDADDVLVEDVRGSMSTKRGVAPARWIGEAVAKKVKGVVITSSPGATPSASSASSSASVPEAQPTAWRVPQ